ncbi:MAG: hypothetical protein Q9M89_05070 [Persephonella sp.]|nr:hypothetical protein [Persephonella sp.]
MDILIAYSHADMFRLDENYYREVAAKQGLKGTEFFKLIDERYVQGKNTPKVEGVYGVKFLKPNLLPRKDIRKVIKTF